ncbi:YggT family protein [Desulfonispora thiosulfatigenes DSM 11270]|uniref:YggT family protein n=1 Tax=Desulfonispora thiosulfatigenes DSM 11270 TaxID=656914 RepID=A0A1W1VMG9_DESTI|nr:YggT family protein [Desulfonispora thiosulfatigenes]SMB94241.1 YggT family protein [Desulfonispora thiosulfatigenes DSM 11270]
MLLFKLIVTAFDVMSWLIIARVLLSWIPHNPQNMIINFIYELTELILGPIRRFMPSLGGLDFSPVIAIIFLDWLLKPLVLSLLSIIL